MPTTPSCSNCQATGAPFLCSRCHSARFCSVACQRSAWPRHKADCVKPSAEKTVLGSKLAAATGLHSGSDLSTLAESLPDLVDDWVAVMNYDAFAGQDAARAQGKKTEDLKKQCVENGFEGFVTWNGMAFFRRQTAKELCAARFSARGTSLYMPVQQLRKAASGDCALPSNLPEVVFEGARPVDKRSRVSQQEMMQRFLRSQPIVLTDAQDTWRAKEKWTFEWFARNFGKDEMPVSDLAPFFPNVDRGVMTTAMVSMNEYVRYVIGLPNAIRPLQKTKEQVFYGNGWTPFKDFEDLLLDASDRLYCVQDTVPRGGQTKDFNNTLTKIFLGPAGTVSRLHHDTFSTHVWLAQIRGRKQFICFPPDDSENLHADEQEENGGRVSMFDPAAPDYERFPRARKARAYSVVVEEGEVVVLPSQWWHWAKSLTPSVTLMRNFMNDTNMNEYMQWRQNVDRMRAKGKGKGGMTC